LARDTIYIGEFGWCDGDSSVPQFSMVCTRRARMLRELVDENGSGATKHLGVRGSYHRERVGYEWLRADLELITVEAHR